VNVLLDTCAFVWAISDPAKLSKRAADVLRDPATQVYFSPITCAEMACLCDRGRLVIAMHWKKWFDHYVKENGWSAVDINVAIMQDAFALPGTFHADPADRIIVATARCHKLRVITADARLLGYPFVESIW
jgi:PIN domain nuclease of toxin-antitoxin system